MCRPSYSWLSTNARLSPALGKYLFWTVGREQWNPGGRPFDLSECRFWRTIFAKSLWRGGGVDPDVRSDLGNSMIEFLSGIFMTTFAACGLIFLKLWMTSKDRFYLLFSAACGLIAIERVVLFLTETTNTSIRTPFTESMSWVYLIRLLAFLLILFAIFEKNRRAKKS
jgi:hypothetical protein